ncbi:LysR family transcriptional regulator [Sodalis sp. C49]|uniref:LysR family transcriptional regulator n=1 Tax=unclassified Sodalis (in: enterobacteria) TaxID=2636512 RepID=UPI003965B972
MKNTALFELQAIDAVASAGSFRQAASQLGISPSALSHRVATLESRLGVRLFNRTTRSVSLSQAGEQLLNRVRPALNEIDAAMEGVNRFRLTPSGRLRLNTAEAAARMILRPIVLEFLRRYPDMTVEIVADGRLVDIVAEGFDAGIRLAESVPLDMIAVPCSPPLRFLVVGAPAYFALYGRAQEPGELVRHRCLRSLLPSGAPLHWQFERRGEKRVVNVSGPLTLDNQPLMIDAALAGAGLAWVSESAAAPYLLSGALSPVLEDWCPRFAGLRLYYPGHRLVPAGLRMFIDLIREVMDSHGDARTPP